jgi:uncharacterized protein
MPRPVPAPDPLSKPFWDACNERKLMVQYCTYCERKEFPPKPACGECGWDFHLTWIEVKGRGIIDGYGITYDTRIRAWAPEQPFNNAVIKLEEDNAIQFFSNLPGVPVGQVPVGATVEVDFIEVEGGQLIPEWKIVG